MFHVEQSEPEAGELAPASVAPEQDEQAPISEEMESALLSLARKFDDQERWANNWLIMTVWKRRMMERGFADAVCSQDSREFQVSPQPGVGLSTVGPESDAAVRPPVRRSYNVFLARERTWAAAFSQTPPGVRFEPEDPEDPNDIAAAEAANTMRRIIEKFNVPKKLAQKAARLCWTDGRIIALTEYVVDAQRFGTDADGSPVGREVVEMFGVLESKVPIVCSSPDLFPYVKIEDELDEAIAKAMYPEIEDKITDAASGATADQTFSRLARITSAEGQGSSRGGGDAARHLRTRARWFMRPSAFYAVHDPDMRQQLLERYPEGCRLTYIGDVLADERPCCMDDHIAVMHAMDGDGQARPSIGDPMMDPQRVTNELLSMVEETFRYCTPMTFMDDNLLDTDAIQELQADPGSVVPIEKRPGEAVEDSIYETSPAQFPPEMMGMVEQLIGPLADKLSSTPPVLAGASMEDQDTARGYAIARDQALGVIGLTWQPYCEFYAEIMGQAVKIAGRSRHDGKLTALVAAASGRKTERVTLDIGDLKGNFRCVAESDANFPEGYTARSNKIMMLMHQTAGSPAVAKILSQPDNQALLLDAIGVEGLVDESVMGRNNQLAEIQEMAAVPPAPNPAFAQWMAAAAAAQATGAPFDAPPPPQMVTSVPIDEDFDDHAAHFEECARWINSAAGQDARRSSPQWVQNVKLHALAHRAALQQQAAASAQPAKPPAESVNFKDVAAVNPAAAAQMLKQAGLQAPPAPQ